MRSEVLFLGHGSPLNIIRDNEWTRTWSELGSLIQRPKAILGVSAHWYSQGTYVTDQNPYKQIYDMYGFPEEIYEIEYQARNDMELMEEVQDILGESVSINNDWGLDHGLWSVLHFIYPQADIPLVILSIDRMKRPEEHFEIARSLRSLRDKGYLILTSGNIVHNLRMTNWSSDGLTSLHKDFDLKVKDKILAGDYESLIDYRKLSGYELAFASPEHYLPLVYALGFIHEDDQVKVFNEGGELGSVSMTSYIWK